MGNPTRTARKVVLVALGISAVLVAALSLNKLRSSPQPPAEVSTEGAMQAYSARTVTADQCLYLECKWAHYEFRPGFMPAASSWSYMKDHHCDKATIEACNHDPDCAGLAGHDDVFQGFPRCWRIKKSKAVHYENGKSEWWLCVKPGYGPLGR